MLRRLTAGWVGYCCCLLCVVQGQVNPYPVTPAIPIQLATARGDGSFAVLTVNIYTGKLIFSTPTQGILIAKKLWLQNGYQDSTLVSLQLLSADIPVSETAWITRVSSDIGWYPTGQPFVMASMEPRLMLSTCCSCSSRTTFALSTFYWLGSDSSGASILTASSDGFLTLSYIGRTPLCSTSGFNLYNYPYVQPVTAPHAIGKRQATGNASSSQPMKIVSITFGFDKYMLRVTSAGPRNYKYMVLPISTSATKKCSKDVYFYQEYTAYTLTRAGLVDIQKAFTLEQVSSKTFVTVDVEPNTLQVNLHFGLNRTGLTQENEGNFSSGLPNFPDYRFFVVYTLPHLGQNLTVVCSFFHRNFCLFPVKTGEVSLAPVNQSVTVAVPTFDNPPMSLLLDFYNRSAIAANEASFPSIDIIDAPAQRRRRRAVRQSERRQGEL